MEAIYQLRFCTDCNKEQPVTPIDDGALVQCRKCSLVLIQAEKVAQAAYPVLAASSRSSSLLSAKQLLFSYAKRGSGNGLPTTFLECHRALKDKPKGEKLDGLVRRCLEEIEDWKERFAYLVEAKFTTHLSNPLDRYQLLKELAEAGPKPPPHKLVKVLLEVGRSCKKMEELTNFFAKQLDDLPADTAVLVLDSTQRMGLDAPFAKADWAKGELRRLLAQDPSYRQAFTSLLVADRRLKTCQSAGHYLDFIPLIWAEAADPLTRLLKEGIRAKSASAWSLLRALPQEASSKIVLEAGLCKGQSLDPGCLSLMRRFQPQTSLAPPKKKSPPSTPAPVVTPGPKKRAAPKRNGLPPAPAPSRYDRLLRALEGPDYSAAVKYWKGVKATYPQELDPILVLLRGLPFEQHSPLATLASEVWMARIRCETDVAQQGQFVMEAKHWGAALPKQAFGDLLKPLLLQGEVELVRQLIQAYPALKQTLKKSVHQRLVNPTSVKLDKSTREQIQLIKVVGGELVQDRTLAWELFDALPIEADFVTTFTVVPAEPAIVSLLRAATFLTPKQQEKITQPLFLLLTKKAGTTGSTVFESFSRKGRAASIQHLSLIAPLPNSLAQLEEMYCLLLEVGKGLPKETREPLFGLLSALNKRTGELTDVNDRNHLLVIYAQISRLSALLEVLGDRGCDFERDSSLMMLEVFGSADSLEFPEIKTAGLLWGGLANHKHQVGPSHAKAYHGYLRHLMGSRIYGPLRDTLWWQVLEAGKGFGFLNKQNGFKIASYSVTQDIPLSHAHTFCDFWSSSGLLSEEETDQLLRASFRMPNPGEEAVFADFLYLAARRLPNMADQHRFWIQLAMEEACRVPNVELARCAITSLAISHGLCKQMIDPTPYRDCFTRHTAKSSALSKDQQLISDLIEGAIFWGYSRLSERVASEAGPRFDVLNDLMEGQDVPVAFVDVRRACTALQLMLVSCNVSSASDEGSLLTPDAVQNLNSYVSRLNSRWEECVKMGTVDKSLSASRRALDAVKAAPGLNTRIQVQTSLSEENTFRRPLLCQSALLLLPFEGLKIAGIFTPITTTSEGPSSEIQFGCGPSALGVFSRYIEHTLSDNWDWEGLKILSESRGVVAFLDAYPVEMGILLRRLLEEGVKQADSLASFDILVNFWSVGFQIGKIGAASAYDQLEVLIEKSSQIPEGRAKGISLLNQYGPPLKLRRSYDRLCRLFNASFG